MHIDHAHVHGHRIRYAVRAGDTSRPPLLLLNGLGANIELALPFIDALDAPSVITYDVPGVGGSPTPPSPYRPSNIARLTAELLDHLGFEEADVLGVSWGGAIAQQFAFQHSSRCRRLVLAATSPGALMVPAQLPVLLKMLTPRRYVDREHALKVAGDVYGGVFRRKPAAVMHAFDHVRFSSRGGYYMQLAAAFGWTSLPWLWTLSQPTLIMAGADDPLVPIVNAYVMQWLIPDARIEILDCGHLFLVTRAEESARIVESFLTESAESGLRRGRRAASRVPSSPLRRMS
ncbi:MAG TPA: poly(3-hydroxyalkanoate) depolymerase [Casimicrobiaceae bacterium]|nr:poly(3-hydroxyalkanoate) depolymerase [Casimicrobiaceae bacterium]